jgi:hypothetical protein
MMEMLLDALLMCAFGFGLCGFFSMTILERRSKGEDIGYESVSLSAAGFLAAVLLSFVTYQDYVAYASRPQPPPPYNLAVVALEDMNKSKVRLVNFLTKHTKSKILIASERAAFTKFDAEVIGKIPFTEGVHEQHELAYYLATNELPLVRYMFVISDQNMGYWSDITVRPGSAMSAARAAVAVMEKKPEEFNIPEDKLKAIENRRVPKIQDVGE